MSRENIVRIAGQLIQSEAIWFVLFTIALSIDLWPYSLLALIVAIDDEAATLDRTLQHRQES